MSHGHDLHSHSDSICCSTQQVVCSARVTSCVGHVDLCLRDCQVIDHERLLEMACEVVWSPHELMEVAP